MMERRRRNTLARGNGSGDSVLAPVLGAADAAARGSNSPNAPNLRAAPPTRAEREGESARAPKPAKQKYPFYVPTDLLERLRNAVHHLPSVTVSGTAVAALEREVGRLEAEYNGGRPFPRRGTEQLPAGRPVSL